MTFRFFRLKLVYTTILPHRNTFYVATFKTWVVNQTVVCSASIWDLEIIVVASLVRHPHFILKFRIYFCVSGLYCFRVSFLDSLKENIRKEILLQSCAPILYQGTYKPTAVIFKQISWSKSFRHSLARSISMRQELCICKERTHWLGISLWRHHASFLLSFFMSASVAPSLFLSLPLSYGFQNTANSSFPLNFVSKIFADWTSEELWSSLKIIWYVS